MSKAEFVVPLVPPTVNHYVKHTRSGRHYITPAATAFKEAVALCSRGQQVEGSEYEVTIGIILGKGVRGDIDNFLKVSLDALVFAGVISSDARVTRLIVSKGRAANPETRFCVVGSGKEY